MAGTNIYSAQDGDWNTASTWSGGVVPTAEDTVTISHKVTFNADFSARIIKIFPNGSLYPNESTFPGASGIKADFTAIMYYRALNDTRRVNMDGVNFADSVVPRITCTYQLTQGLPPTFDIVDGNGVIIDDPGFISSSAILRDIKPEGCTPAYAEKVSNAVRYLTATVHVKASNLRPLVSLYRMARGPFQVLLVTHSCLIKGFIESVVPDPASVGKEYITVKVTITEGPGA